MLKHDGFIDEKRLLSEVGALDPTNGYSLGLITALYDKKKGNVMVQIVQTCESLTIGWISNSLKKGQ